MTTKDGFTHSKTGSHVELYNGSEVTSLNSVPENIRGARSNLNVYDEGAFISPEMYTASLPFTTVDSGFKMGKNLQVDLFPPQLPNLNLLLSSASDTTCYMYTLYREAFKQMMLGNTDYFVADLDYHQSTAPFVNGNPMKPLVSMEEVERLYATQPFRAEREFGNKWSGDVGEDVIVKRSTLDKFSQTYYPTYYNDGTKKYIIAYDPSSRQDNSCVLVAELFRDEEKGLMVKLVNLEVLVEQLKGGQIAVLQKPKQLEIVKEMIVNYNFGYNDYEGLDSIHIDAGSGGGGFEIGQYLLNDFQGPDKKTHRGLIDIENDYMKLRADDYPGAAEILNLVSFTKKKQMIYQATANALNQGLVIWPTQLNVKNELEFEITNPDGSLSIKYEKPSLKDIDALIQLDLAKEELMGIQRVKKPNGTIAFEPTPQAKLAKMHDDRADCVAMICYRLMQLRNADALDKEQNKSDFSGIFQSGNKKKPNKMKEHNPFLEKLNPFSQRNYNPFK